MVAEKDWRKISTGANPRAFEATRPQKRSQHPVGSSDGAEFFSRGSKVAGLETGRSPVDPLRCATEWAGRAATHSFRNVVWTYGNKSICRDGWNFFQGDCVEAVFQRVAQWAGITALANTPIRLRRAERSWSGPQQIRQRFLFNRGLPQRKDRDIHRFRAGQ